MANGYSLHIGINYLDVDHYGTRGFLRSCERDAFAMERIAQARGFQTRRLKTVESTRERVLGLLRELSANARSGDLVWITYSGHGAQVADPDGDEADGLDETWCLHDAQLLDDEVYRLLCTFPPGVRICLLTDSCHNQTVHKDGGTRRVGGPIKALSTAESNDAYVRNTGFYRGVQERLRHEAERELRAALIVLAPCEDDDFAIPGEGKLDLSEFSAWVKFVHRGGAFQGTYQDFIERIREHIRDRIPQLMYDGPEAEVFLKEQPFTIG